MRRSSEVELKPGWLKRDIAKAHERVHQLKAIEEGARLARRHNIRDAALMLTTTLALALLLAWVM